jgi:hypothetical protein
MKPERKDQSIQQRPKCRSELGRYTVKETEVSNFGELVGEQTAGEQFSQSTRLCGGAGEQFPQLTRLCGGGNSSSVWSYEGIPFTTIS